MVPHARRIVLVLPLLFVLLVLPRFSGSAEAAWTVRIVVNGTIDEVFTTPGADLPDDLTLGSTYRAEFVYEPLTTAVVDEFNSTSIGLNMPGAGLRGEVTAGSRTWKVPGSGFSSFPHWVIHSVHDPGVMNPDQFVLNLTAAGLDPSEFPGLESFDVGMGLETSAPTATPDALWIDGVGALEGHIDDAGDIDFTNAEASFYLRTSGTNEWRVIDDDPRIDISVVFEPVDARTESFGALKSRY